MNAQISWASMGRKVFFGGDTYTSAGPLLRMRKKRDPTEGVADFTSCFCVGKFKVSLRTRPWKTQATGYKTPSARRLSFAKMRTLGVQSISYWLGGPLLGGGRDRSMGRLRPLHCVSL